MRSSLSARRRGSRPTLWRRTLSEAGGCDVLLIDSAYPRARSALRGGAPVGTGYSILSEGRTGPCVYVAGVGVVPEARGRGIGAALVSWLVTRGFERGATLAHLHPDDDGAARLYARLGFVEVPGFNAFVNQ